MEIKLLPIFIEEKHHENEIIRKIQEQMKEILNASSYQVEANLKKTIEQILGEKLTNDMIPIMKELLREKGYIITISTDITYYPEEKIEHTANVFKLEKSVNLSKLTSI